MQNENQIFSPGRRFLPWIRWITSFSSALFLVYFLSQRRFNEISYVAVSLFALWCILTYRPINQYIEVIGSGRKFVFHITVNLIGAVKLVWRSNGRRGVVHLGKVSYTSSRLKFSAIIENQEYSFVFFNPAGRRYFAVLADAGDRGVETLVNIMKF